MLRALLLVLLMSWPAFAQWQILDTHSTADFRGVSSLGKGVVWISGTNGTVLRSEDAGFLWQHCTMPPGAEHLDFRGIQAFDANTAIVMSSGKGDLSRLYKTTDGCQTWRLVFTNPDKDGFWDAVQFLSIAKARNHQLSVDHASGVLLGDPVDGEFRVFLTNDGGDTWRRRITQKRDKQHLCRVDSFKALNGETVFAVSNEELLFPHPYLFFFVTGGLKSRLAYVDHFDLDFSFCHESTKYLDLPLGGSSSSGAFAVAMKDPDFTQPLQIMIVGGDYQKPDVITSTSVFLSPEGKAHSLFPSGVSVTQASTPPHGYRSAVAYDEAAKVWITVGPNGTDVSGDDGRNWRALKPIAGDAVGADRDWNALSLPYVVGPHGRVGMLEPAALGGAAR